MSITKSMIDYYHNYKNVAVDDLMSLYKHNT